MHIPESTFVRWLGVHKSRVVLWHRRGYFAGLTVTKRNKGRYPTRLYEETELNQWLAARCYNFGHHPPVTVAWLRKRHDDLIDTPTVLTVCGWNDGYKVGIGADSRHWPHILLPNGHRRYFKSYIEAWLTREQPSMYKQSDVLAALGVERRWLRQRLKSTPVGGHAMYAADDVEALVMRYHPPHTLAAARAWLRMFTPAQKWHLVTMAAASEAVGARQYVMLDWMLCGEIPHLALPSGKRATYRVPIEVARAVYCRHRHAK